MAERRRRSLGREAASPGAGGRLGRGRAL